MRIFFNLWLVVQQQPQYKSILCIQAEFRLKKVQYWNLSIKKQHG